MSVQWAVECLLSFLPPSIGMVTGIVAALISQPIATLRILSGQEAYTPDTYKSFPRGVTQLRTIVVNGARHAVLIRGCDIRKPVLLVLHGGPGATDIPFQKSYGQYLELDFVVVHYDQRGACKSAVHNASIPGFNETLSIEQHTDDAIQIAEWFVQNTDYPGAKDGIFLLGGSWGTMLAQLVVSTRPELFRKVVFRGLAWNGPVSEPLSTAFVVQQMTRLQYSSEAISMVKKLTYPYDTNISDMIKQREWLTAMGGQTYEIEENLPKPLWKLSHDTARALCLCPEMTLAEMLSMKKNMVNTLFHMWPHVERVNMLEQVPSLTIPLLVIHGRHDNCTAHSLVEEYLSKLEAPVKKLIWFDKSGHSPQKEEPVEFAAAVKHFFLGPSGSAYSGQYPIQEFKNHEAISITPA